MTVLIDKSIYLKYWQQICSVNIESIQTEKTI